MYKLFKFLLIFPILLHGLMQHYHPEQMEFRPTPRILSENTESSIQLQYHRSLLTHHPNHVQFQAIVHSEGKDIRNIEIHEDKLYYRSGNMLTKKDNFIKLTQTSHVFAIDQSIFITNYKHMGQSQSGHEQTRHAMKLTFPEKEKKGHIAIVYLLNQIKALIPMTDQQRNITAIYDQFRAVIQLENSALLAKGYKIFPRTFEETVVITQDIDKMIVDLGSIWITQTKSSELIQLTLVPGTDDKWNQKIYSLQKQPSRHGQVVVTQQTEHELLDHVKHVESKIRHAVVNYIQANGLEFKEKNIPSDWMENIKPGMVVLMRIGDSRNERLYEYFLYRNGQEIWAVCTEDPTKIRIIRVIRKVVEIFYAFTTGARAEAYWKIYLRTAEATPRSVRVTMYDWSQVKQFVAATTFVDVNTLKPQRFADYVLYSSKGIN